MKHARSFATLALASTLVFGACAGGSAPMADPAPAPMPAEPEHVDPTGDYEVALELGGQMVDGFMTIEGDRAGGYFGSIETGMGGAAITVEVDGDEVVLIAADVGVEVYCRMDDEGVLEGDVDGAMGQGTFFASPVEG